MDLPKFQDYKGEAIRYISPKMDGHMMHVHTDKCGNICCMSKNGKNITEKVQNVRHIWRTLIKLPTCTELFGELYAPNVPATSVPTMLIEGDSRLHYRVFAAPIINNTLSDGFTDAMKELEKYGVETIPVIDFTLPGKLNQTIIDMLLMIATITGLEGYVLKESHMDGWYKLKPVKTIDAFVTDVTESDSDTYKGYMKAVKLGLYRKDGSVHDLGECGGGFTKEFKMELPYEEMKQLLLGRVGSFEFDSVTVHGKLRFPRIAKDRDGFMVWRTDKDANQCTVEQLER